MLARLWYSRGMRRDVPILSHKPVTRSRDELIARWSVLALMAVGLAYTAALVAGIAPDNFDASTSSLLLIGASSTRLVASFRSEAAPFGTFRSRFVLIQRWNA